MRCQDTERRGVLFNSAVSCKDYVASMVDELNMSISWRFGGMILGKGGGGAKY